jgi:hypothetical protein
MGRRAFLRSASAAATVTTVGLAAPGTALADPRRRRPAPDTIELPVGIRPEGITSGPGGTYYVGSLADGRIVTGNLFRGTSSLLLEGAEGRALRGLQWDRRTGLVWAAGNVGEEAHVYAVHSRTGAIVSDTVVPDGQFLNDLAVTRRAVWVTDSRANPDGLTMIALGPGGEPAGAAPVFVPLGGAWPAGDGMAINANGIRELPDGSLVLNNSRVGGLWQVDPETGATVAIPISGSPAIIAGDGLELRGRTLYNVRGSGPDQVSVLRLSRSDGAWAARSAVPLADATLDVPTTATVAGGWLWTVNARFGTVPDPDAADYWISRLRAR